MGSSTHNSHTTNATTDTSARTAMQMMKFDSNQSSRSPRSRNNCIVVRATTSKTMPTTSMRARPRSAYDGSGRKANTRSTLMMPMGMLM